MKKSYDSLEKTVWFYNSVTVVFVGLIVFLVLMINESENKITELEAVIKKHNNTSLEFQDAKDELQDTKESIQVQNERVHELELANKALMKVISNTQFRKVAQNTPLPKLIRV